MHAAAARVLHFVGVDARIPVRGMSGHVELQGGVVRQVHRRDGRGCEIADDVQRDLGRMAQGIPHHDGVAAHDGPGGIHRVGVLVGQVICEIVYDVIVQTSEL